MRNILPKEDHAAVAAHVDGQCLILDNNRVALVRDTSMAGCIPSRVLDADGTRRLVPSKQAAQAPGASQSSPASSSGPAVSAVVGDRLARRSSARINHRE